MLSHYLTIRTFFSEDVSHEVHTITILARFLPMFSFSYPARVTVGHPTLHWLPVRERTDFKLSVIIFKSLICVYSCLYYKFSHTLWTKPLPVILRSAACVPYNRKSRIIFNVDSFFILIVYYYPLLFFIFLFWFYCLLTSLATLPVLHRAYCLCPVIYKNCLCSWSSTNREHFVLIALCVTLLSNLNIAEVTDGGN